MVDAKHIWLHLEDSSELREQIAFPNVILLNKTALVTPAELDDLEMRQCGMNGLARLHHTVNTETDIPTVLDVGEWLASRGGGSATRAADARYWL